MKNGQKKRAGGYLLYTIQKPATYLLFNFVQAGEENVEAQINGLWTVVGTPLEDASSDFNYGSEQGDGDSSFQWQSHYNGK